jgi:alkylation response protein AidB-like acyl-CoA dehydrogenase
MDFRVSDDQRELAQGIRSLLEGRLPLDHIREAEHADVAISTEDWLLLGQTGVFALTRPEPEGIGLGLADAVVVFEELGRALIPGPLVGTFLAAAAGLMDGAAEGARSVGVHVEGDGPILIEHLASLSALLVLSHSDARLLDAVSLRPQARRIEASLCPLTPLWQVDELGTGAELAGTGRAELADKLRRDGQLLSAALQVGHATATLELAVAYAKQRQQFGQPIGSFQAIKHICADMLVRAEVARSAVHAAACLADDPEAATLEAKSAGRGTDEIVTRAVMGAKLLADEAALANARAAIQVHGGMGFTWEVPLHLHLKRSRVLATTFGSPAELAVSLSALI